MTTQDKPLVSVIICFLNVEAYIEETIASVLQQRYTQWELVLLDDGSTDKSTAIAQEYVRLYPDRIRYYEHEGHVNKGASASRNVAMRFAKGQLLAFLDADDIWFPDKLEVQVGLLQQFPEAIMLLEATEYWHSWTQSDHPDVPKLIGTEPDRLYYPPELLLNLYPLGEGEAPSMSGLIMKNVATEASWFEDAFTGMYDDQVFLTKMYLRGPVYISSACHHRYRQRTGSVMANSRVKGDYYRIRLTYLKWLGPYLKSKGISDARIRLKLHQALRYTRYIRLRETALFLKQKVTQYIKVLF